MELFVTMVHGRELFINIFMMSTILDVLAVALDPPPYVDILYNSQILRVLQILNYL